MAKLTPKQDRFIDEYLIDLNATQAAIRAGYSAKSARIIGVENLSKHAVQEELKPRMEKRANAARVDATYVFNRMVEIDKMDVLDIMNDEMELKPVSQWPKVWRQYLSGFDLAEMFEGTGKDKSMVGIMKKIKWPDKTKNLELLARYFGLLTDKKVITTPPGQPIEHKHTYGSTELLKDFYAASQRAVSAAAVPGSGEDMGQDDEGRDLPEGD